MLEYVYHLLCSISRQLSNYYNEGKPMNLTLFNKFKYLIQLVSPQCYKDLFQLVPRSIYFLQVLIQLCELNLTSTAQLPKQCKVAKLIHLSGKTITKRKHSNASADAGERICTKC